MNISFTPKYTNNKRRDCFTGNSSLEIKLERSNSLRKSGSRSFLFPVFTLVPRNVFQFAFFLETEAIRVRIGTFQNTFPVVFSTTAKFVLLSTRVIFVPLSSFELQYPASSRNTWPILFVRFLCVTAMWICHEEWDFRCISQRFFDISLFVFSVIQLFGSSGEWIAWKRHEFHVILRLAFWYVLVEA